MLRAPASSLPPPFPDALRVAVIQGGPSSEAEVSRVSSAAVAGALAKCGHDVTRLECDRTLPARLLEVPFDVVFPVVHGAVGEDGALQGLLELLSLPYVGAGVLASALANDKVQAKVAFRAAGLPVAEELVLLRGSATVAELSARAIERVGKSVVVKPATQGSSIGVTLLPGLSGADDRALHEAIAKGFALDEKVLIERFVHGKEITCGVLEIDEPAIGAPDGAVALPPTEIVSKAAHWYDFQSRYGRGGSEHLCPAPLSKEITERVQAFALGAHRALGVRDLSRADFVVAEDGEVVLLEVNTMPGMTATSLFPEAAGVAGVPFDKLCDRLVHGAKTRGTRRRNAAVPFPT
jgi:D-alanine-D-alanine ligase